MSKRTDIHAPSNINPEDYVNILSFCRYSTDDSFAYGMDELRAMYTGEPQKERVPHQAIPFLPADYVPREITMPKEKFFRNPLLSGCHHCGAHHRYGSVLKHLETGECITVGWQCAEKLDLHDAETFRAIRKKAELRRRAHREKSARRALLREAITDDPALRTLLKVDHAITRDIRSRFIRHGARISDAQRALLERLARETAERAAETPGVAPDDERREIEGEILSIKEKRSHFGGLAMTVKVTDDDGTTWRAWGTAPAAVLDATQAMSSPRGVRVRFVAAFRRSDTDRAFAFFKRPTRVVVLETADAQ